MTKFFQWKFSDSKYDFERNNNNIEVEFINEENVNFEKNIDDFFFWEIKIFSK